MLSTSQHFAILGTDVIWHAALALHRVLTDLEVPHAFAGDIAVCLHGYHRNTIDVDLLVRSSDAELIRTTLDEAGWTWDESQKQFESASGAILQFVYAGVRAGVASEVRLPDPADIGTTTTLEDLPVLALARLIESKVACGEGNLRRTHRDFADVVELIAVHGLGSDFARNLRKSLRATYRTLVKHARN